jgi:hypothetical protein
MPKSQRPYSPEFRQRIIELVRKGPNARGVVAPVRFDRPTGMTGAAPGSLTTGERQEGRRLRDRVVQGARSSLSWSRSSAQPVTVMAKQVKSCRSSCRVWLRSNT